MTAVKRFLSAHHQDLKRTALGGEAAGEQVFHVFGAIAHFERRLIAERTKEGIAVARARGKVPGRQPLDADKVQAANSSKPASRPLRPPVNSGSAARRSNCEAAAANVRRTPEPPATRPFAIRSTLALLS